MIATLLLTLPLVAQDPATPPPPPAIPADTEVVETASGLRYSVLQAGGPGTPPQLGDVVRVHYTGWLVDGTVFDSSVQRGTPAEFGMGGVIEGWNEALQLMTPGARWKLTIPPALAYGEEGSGDIPPDSTLVFEVELLDVVARHSLSCLPWSAEGAVPAEGGIEVRVLEPGRSAEPVDQRAVVWVEFGLWTEAGEFLFSDLLAGRPLVTDPKRPQLAFLAQILPHATEGSLVQARVPMDQMPELMGLDKLAGETHALWQFRMRAASDLQKPEFRLPSDEELTTTASGLRYLVLREGSALHPTGASTVVAHYAGWLTDGTPFDSSYDRGQPLNSPLTRLVKGWQEGIPQMGRGALVLLVVPPELGYGDREKTNIPAGSTLVFAIELIDFR